MKKNLLCSFLMVAMCVNAQVTIDDFEKSNNQWDNVSCSSGVVDNPYQTGLNVSCKCLQITRAPGCENWSGAIYTLPSSVTGYKYVHALMYRNNTHNPNLKITDNGSNLDMIPTNAIVANQWQDVVFDISDKAQADFIMFMADRNDITEDVVVYIDDIIFSNNASPRTTPNTACSTTPEPGGYGDYQLVWNEDFTESSLDLNAWNIETNGNGGGNNELQYYCDRGVKLGIEPTTGKHCLILTATKEDYQGKKCTSGRVNSQGKTYYTYGRIDARIKFPNTANGLWPAFWQMGNNYKQVGWPKCGETDIIEMGHKDGFNNRQNRYFNGAMHLGRAWNAVWQDAQAHEWAYSLQDTFHILTMVWTPTSVDMYMDKHAHPENDAYFHADLEPNEDADYNRQLVFGKPNFIIANVAIGGNFPGLYDINKITALANGPRSMYIDWIRIYQRGDAGQSFFSNAPSDPIEPESVSSISNTPSTEIQNGKVLRDGHLYILRNGNLYDLNGRLIQ